MTEPTTAAVEEVARINLESRIQYEIAACKATGRTSSLNFSIADLELILALPSVGWRTIDSAPRNGEPVTIYVPIHQPDRRILTAYWTDAGWWICSGSIVTGKPSHWKPLDPPPQPVEDR